jgi:hypothetical protein
MVCRDAKDPTARRAFARRLPVIVSSNEFPAGSEAALIEGAPAAARSRQFSHPG